MNFVSVNEVLILAGGVFAIEIITIASLFSMNELVFDSHRKILMEIFIKSYDKSTQYFFSIIIEIMIK